jgi:hypothetical protein
MIVNVCPAGIAAPAAPRRPGDTTQRLNHQPMKAPMAR